MQGDRDVQMNGVAAPQGANIQWIVDKFSATQRRRVYERLMNQYRAAADRKDLNWCFLQAAHIVAQPQMALHCSVHTHMLRQAWRDHDSREVLGQLLRLALVPIGHMIGRLPKGNTGRSDVSALKPMDLKPELALLIEQAWKAGDQP